MQNKQAKKVIILSAVFALVASKGLAQDAFSPFYPNTSSSIRTINTNNNQPPNGLTIDLSDTRETATIVNLSANDTFYHLVNATDKFVQCNIKSSWDDFQALINNSGQNDFVYIALANKMADLGLFDLANSSVLKIKDKDIAGASIEDMKRYYYPRRKLKLEDELFLAEAYSNIIYNNQSSEATNELLKNEALLSTSDYANYLVALGSYKSNFFPRAKKYINIALIQNPSNLNYQGLKAEILAEGDESEEAIKTIDNLKKQSLDSYEYARKVKSLEQFILYKTQKNESDKNYHLGYYYYLENDNSKAIRTLQSAIGTRLKSNNGRTYALMSEIYLNMNEFEKALDTAKKSYKLDRNNPKALMALGDLDYRDKKYKEALEYYKKASSQDKKSYKPLVKEAQTYQKLSNTKKAKEIYVKILKTHSDSWEAYYNIALLDGDKRVIYLKKALAIYPLFEDAWIELTKVEIDNGNYDIAQKYLSNAFYIDENDFRYYYYQGLINNNLGDLAQARYNFKKCLKLKPNYQEALKAIDSIGNSEINSPKQDSI